MGLGYGTGTWPIAADAVGYDGPDRRNRQRSKHLKIRDNRALAVPFIRAFSYKFVGEIARIACQSLTWAGSKLWLQQERSVFGPPEPFACVTKSGNRPASMISSLSDTQSLSSAMYPGPAQELASRYALRLSPVWQNWFERGAELLSETGEFSQPAEVPMLIEQRPELIWPGFMLPDTLPILGNGYGDWLCMRVNADKRGRSGALVPWRG